MLCVYQFDVTTVYYLAYAFSLAIRRPMRKLPHHPTSTMKPSLLLLVSRPTQVLVQLLQHHRLISSQTWQAVTDTHTMELPTLMMVQSITATPMRFSMAQVHFLVVKCQSPKVVISESALLL